MNKIEIRIKTDNASFGQTFEEKNNELARILQQLAKRLINGEDIINANSTLLDSNGQTVGAILEK